jgi:hypothetical protein
MNRNALAACSCAFGACCTAWATPVLPVLPTIPTSSLQATDFGVKADSSTDNATNLQKALDSIANAGGGVLHLPAAKKPYLTGPIVVKSNTDLRIDSGAVLQMLPYARYPRQADSSFLPWISSNKVHDIAFSGYGTLEGNGAAWWIAFDSGWVAKRPEMIRVYGATRASVTGLRFRNAPNVHMVFRYATTDVTVRNVNILSPGNSPNTDGCDLEGKRYLFDHDTIRGGDDNIAIQPNHDSTSEITVQDCLLGTGHGLSIGSWCNNGVRNLLAQRINFVGTTAGIRMKAGRDRGSIVRDLVYQDITMTDVQHPLYITSYYPSSPATTATDTLAPITLTTPNWRNIQVTNLTSTSSLKGYNSVEIYALPEMAVDSLTLTNVHFTAPNAFSIQHSHEMLFSDVSCDGSTTAFFGTSRDVTYRKATTQVAAEVDPPVGQKLVRRGSETVLEIAAPGEAKVRRIFANGSHVDLGACGAPCSLRWTRRACVVSWVEVEQEGRRTVLPESPW